MADMIRISASAASSGSAGVKRAQRGGDLLGRRAQLGGRRLLAIDELGHEAVVERRGDRGRESQRGGGGIRLALGLAADAEQRRVLARQPHDVIALAET